MSIGRKHFRAIASVVAGANYLTHEQRNLLAKQLSNAIKGVAGNMDPDRFLEACGVEEGALE